MLPETKKKLSYMAFFTAEMAGLLLVFLVSFSVFVYLTREVFVLQNHRFDSWVFQKMREIRSAELTGFMESITFFGSKNFFIAVPIGLTVFFLFFRNWWLSVYIFVTTLGSVILNQYFKNNFLRLRPDTAFYFQSGYSFPSGHAMIGASFYGVLIYLIWRRTQNKWLRICLCLVLLLWQLLISFSRVYLNVHYATDVLAGLAAGIFWLFLAVLCINHFEKYYHRRIENRKSSQPIKQETKS